MSSQGFDWPGLPLCQHQAALPLPPRPADSAAAKAIHERFVAGGRGRRCRPFRLRRACAAQHYEHRPEKRVLRLCLAV